MKRLKLDFAHPQGTVSTARRPYGVVLLAGALALAAGLALHYRNLDDDISTAEDRIARLKRQARGVAAESLSPDVMEEVQSVNRAASRLTIPWENLFQAVESVSDKRIALLSLQPNFPKRELKISGEAEDFPAIRQYIERLEETRAVADVRIVSHEVVTRPNAMQIRFELFAKWNERA